MTIELKDMGVVDYESVYRNMVEFTLSRNHLTTDEIWFVEHPPVYTLGLGGDVKHILNADDIPVVKTDRGGQVTYHGPGQLVAYLMLDLSQRPYAAKKFVNLIEEAIIQTLAKYKISSSRRDKAPGVYVDDKKIAALGIRLKKGCSYHGLSINVDMNLTPFRGINPCGYTNLECTQMIDYKTDVNIQHVKKYVYANLVKYLDVYSDRINNVA